MDFAPRPYQAQLMKIGVEKNSIIYLPTGTGKTFIALMILKQLSADLNKKYGEGGKISILIANSIPLVKQHAIYLQTHTIFNIGNYTGDMNIDYWNKEEWAKELNENSVLIMTPQILVNIIMSAYIDLNKVNLIIFDECHHATNDHPMRQIMLNYDDLQEPPRIIGLTASLLNRNVNVFKVVSEIETLETTLQSKVATVDGLQEVIGFATNPIEKLHVFKPNTPCKFEEQIIRLLENTMRTVSSLRLEKTIIKRSPQLINLYKEDNLKDLKNFIADLVFHIKKMGVYGGLLACKAHLIQVHRIKLHCSNVPTCYMLEFVCTVLSHIQTCMEKFMGDISEEEKIFKYSSDQVLQLINIFKIYKETSSLDLCSVIFCERRLTAKILFLLLKKVSENLQDLSYIKPDYMTGYNNNPYNCSLESLYLAKKNNQVLNNFKNREINVICSSNVLEEGIDVPNCSLIVKFDFPTNYCSYIQSKGRARHKESQFFILVETKNYTSLCKKFNEFQLIEKTLNSCLIGKNAERSDPLPNSNDKEILPPYYTKGPNSARVTVLSSISLLCAYCNSLPADDYTQYSPEWYCKNEFKRDKKLYKVVIYLPVICPYLDPIEGIFCENLVDAKRTAALKACEILHKLGELDDNLVPRERKVSLEDFSHLFSHYPEIKEKAAGNSKNRRLHKKAVPEYLKQEISPNEDVFLHLIKINPKFQPTEDIRVQSIYEMYASSLCFGFITKSSIPKVCDFEIYVSQGTLRIELQPNVSVLRLNAEELDLIKGFHFLLFNDILNILKPFVAYDTDCQGEIILLVPVNRDSLTVNFAVLENHQSIKNRYEEPSLAEKQNLEVTQETYLKKIVSPWYRHDGNIYLVIEVCLNRSPRTEFPNEDYANFVEYFKEKHKQIICNEMQPLLFVKALSQRLNMIKPRNLSGKRNHRMIYEEMDEYLVPELLIKQEFPADLWIQASLLPTILSRLMFLFQAEDLRKTVAFDLGFNPIEEHEPLQPEMSLIAKDYTEDLTIKEEDASMICQDVDEADFKPLLFYNKDYCNKLLDDYYGWKAVEEPVDIDRTLDVKLSDIIYYNEFMQKPREEKLMPEFEQVERIPALTYFKEYEPKSINLLNLKSSRTGPILRNIYQALTTAHANDIVNLERMETLGDAVLKLISSLYIIFKYPEFDEGLATSLKGKLVSNQNLYYLAVKKNLAGYMRHFDLSSRENWLPPGYAVPKEFVKDIFEKKIAISGLFQSSIPWNEQINGILSKDTIEDMRNSQEEYDNEESSFHSMCQFIHSIYIGDKFVADSVEALIGAYFQAGGLSDAIRFIEWIGIIPASERFNDLLKAPPLNPIIDPNSKELWIRYYLPQKDKLEELLGYKFKNPAYLLQALTHSSFLSNRITRSYQTLEFLGDAVLDFLITCYIYENFDLDPGQMTDLRSALVNNNTFASLLVQNDLHKFILLCNAVLQKQIDKFYQYLKMKNFEIDDEVLILLEENDVNMINMAEYVDVPKTLGDVFESLAGAVFLDSGKDLLTVWNVFYKIMWKTIDKFGQNTPKNILRRLYEANCNPSFTFNAIAAGQKCMVTLNFTASGRMKKVYGFGTNKNLAKKAAAKLALRSLE